MEGTSNVAPPTILVGVVVWCPADREARAQVIQDFFASIRSAQCGKSGPEFDLAVIDNDTGHPEVLRLLEGLEGDGQVRMVRARPQLGWAGGRNRLIEIFMQGSWDLLLLLDQDIFISDPTWPQQMRKLWESEPSLHAYLFNRAGAKTVFDAGYVTGTLTLDSGRECLVCFDYDSGAHVIDRTVVMAIGGYNTRDFPLAWGWHDCEYGRRLRASGLLDSTRGAFVDPFGIRVEHRDTSQNDPKSVQMMKQAVDQYLGTFRRIEGEIARGERSLFFPYSADPQG